MKSWYKPLMAGCCLAAVCEPCFAQTTADPAGAPARENSQAVLEEIVVTAQKRAERLQDVPVSVTAVTSNQLANAGVGTVLDLKVSVPSVNVLPTNGYIAPYIRGVGSRATGPGIESPVATYIDGVYIGATTATLLSFNNVERVEVLRGPQGTLFGRNATGGLIQVITRDPSATPGGEVNLTYANYDTMKGDFYLTGGIADGLSADLAGYASGMGDGYGTNLATGRDVYRTNYDFGLRTKWLYESGDTKLRFAFDYSRMKTSMNAQSIYRGATSAPPYSLPAPLDAYDLNTDVQPNLLTESYGGYVRLDHDFGFASLASITAYRESTYDNTFDLDLTPQVARRNFVGQSDYQFSQELQLLSPSGGAFTWVAGVYYWNAKGRFDPAQVTLSGVAIPPPGFNRVLTQVSQKTEAIAGFGQATYELLPRTNLTLGIRVTHEERTPAGDQRTLAPDGTVVGAIIPATGKLSITKPTFRVSLDHKFTPDVMGYVSFNRGFKSGGFNGSAPDRPPFEPEVLDAYEGGLKSTLLDNRLRLNAAAFYYKYSDIQVQRILAGLIGIYNGAKARVYGFELDGELQVTDGLRLHAAYSYLNSRFTSFNNAVINVPNPAGGTLQIEGIGTGNQLPNSPKSSINLDATYTVPLGDGDLAMTANYYHNSGFFTEVDNVLRQPAFDLVNASIRYRAAAGWTASLWAQNLFDERYNAYLSHIVVGGNRATARENLAPPRTYGVTLGYEF